MNEQRIELLDHGYIKLVKVFGDELEIYNAAGESYCKTADELEERHYKILRKCARDRHNVFRHVGATFEVKAPLFVCNQMHRYIVASLHTNEQFGWNERSFRYTKDNFEFYVPDEGHEVDLDIILHDYQTRGRSLYRQALQYGLKPERARGFLPAFFLYTTWLWTGSLECICHAIDQRTDPDSSHPAQEETAKYFQAVRQLVEPYFPHVVPTLIDESPVRRIEYLETQLRSLARDLRSNRSIDRQETADFIDKILN